MRKQKFPESLGAAILGTLERVPFPRSGIFVVCRLATVQTNATRPCDTHQGIFLLAEVTAKSQSLRYNRGSIFAVRGIQENTNV